jgi:hypothetical protein
VSQNVPVVVTHVNKTFLINAYLVLLVILMTQLIILALLIWHVIPLKVVYRAQLDMFSAINNAFSAMWLMPIVKTVSALMSIFAPHAIHHITWIHCLMSVKVVQLIVLIVLMIIRAVSVLLVPI